MLIQTVASGGAAAVIPEDQVVTLRRIVHDAVVDERLEHLGIRHQLVLRRHRRAGRAGDPVGVKERQCGGIVGSVGAPCLPKLVIVAADRVFVGILKNRESQIVRVAQILAFHVPFIGAAGHHEASHILVGAEPRFHDLLEIIRRHRTILFQIGAADIKQDRALRFLCLRTDRCSDRRRRYGLRQSDHGDQQETDDCR